MSLGSKKGGGMEGWRWRDRVTYQTSLYFVLSLSLQETWSNNLFQKDDLFTGGLLIG